MSNRTVKFLFLFIIIQLIGCTKSTIERAPEIKAGDHSGMIINFYDTTLIGGYYSQKAYNIDLDNNGLDDFQFVSWIWGSPGMGQIPQASINCLHCSAKVLGIVTTDTMYLNRDTLIFEGTQPRTWDMYLMFNYSCIRISSNDTILNTNLTFKINPLERDDKIRKSDPAICDSLTLTSGNKNSWPMLIGVSGDTTIYRYDIDHNNCNNFPLEKNVYLGVLLDDERLGWIKINIINNFKIIIHESGIQE
ncbi:MAG TPA: hypothetical protein PK692_08470 [Bacteroidales bacterium]|nr:hypothetical protein [Bacteroidales bacterium]HOG67346.1 hypothetical protein [Bacteroidales bacterium]HPA13133.1 hypothetical protein [Bacteroidales bacterium]HQH14663.1 hypothetical protein [Bacteroidales bacterium]HQO08076.1 hypothetical protein [Bacteroidales bacterium]